MNRSILLAFLLVIGLSAGHLQAQPLEISWNENWKFIRLDAAGFEQAGTVDQYWKTVHLPHTWNAEDAFDDERGYHQGVGCYRKQWTFPASWKGKVVYLEVLGANHTAQLYVNGNKAEEHKGGYTAFRTNITPYLRFGEPNLLAFRVSNAQDPTVAPLSADFTFYGGLYRGVRLLVEDPLHFWADSAGTDAVFLHPALEKGKGKLRVEGRIHAPVAENVTVHARILDPKGAELGKQTKVLKSKAGVHPTFSLDFAGLSVGNWSPENPVLYPVEVEIRKANGQLVDSWEGRTAFYSFSMNPDQGALLNGKPLKMMGACRHQDAAGLGNALGDAQHRADIASLKEMGANTIRIAHYPQAAALLDACDELGILAWEEIPIVNEITPAPEFFASCEQQLREMIAQHRNHPSVVMWGYMNEVFLAFGKQKTDSAKNLHTRETVRLARRLDSIARKLDPARLTTMALHNSPHYNKSGISEVPQVIGWNLYHGWYHDAFPDFGTFMDKEQAAYPKRIHLISEFGAGSDIRLYSNQPSIYDFTPQYQLLYHQSYLKQILERPWLAGGIMWNLVDFGSEGRKETMPHINNKGLLTMDRRRKDAWYLYKAFLNAEPMAHLAVSDWDGKVLADGDRIRLPIISNLDTVLVEMEGGLKAKVPIRDRMGLYQIGVPENPFSITLRTVFGKWLGQTQVTPVRPPDVRSPSFRELRVNVGSTVAYKEPLNGQIWFPTQAYTAGSWGTVGGKVFRSGKNRLGSQAYVDWTPHQPLFQTMQDSLQAFRADVPDGEYTVELLFAELEPNIKPTAVLYDLSSSRNPNKTGQNRVFRVSLNGTLLRDSFEPASDPGGFKAMRLETRVKASGGLGIRVDFEPILGNPILNGIAIRKRD